MSETWNCREGLCEYCGDCMGEERPGDDLGIACDDCRDELADEHEYSATAAE